MASLCCWVSEKCNWSWLIGVVCMQVQIFIIFQFYVFTSFIELADDDAVAIAMFSCWQTVLSWSLQLLTDFLSMHFNIRAVFLHTMPLSATWFCEESTAGTSILCSILLHTVAPCTFRALENRPNQFLGHMLVWLSPALMSAHFILMSSACVLCFFLLQPLWLCSLVLFFHVFLSWLTLFGCQYRCNWLERLVSKMTYTVLIGMFNNGHAFTHSCFIDKILLLNIVTLLHKYGICCSIEFAPNSLQLL